MYTEVCEITWFCLYMLHVGDHFKKSNKRRWWLSIILFFYEVYILIVPTLYNYLYVITWRELKSMLTMLYKSTQRVYNTFEKGQTPPLFFLHNVLSFSLRKKKAFCLVTRILHWSLLPSSSPPILSPFLFFTLLLLSVRFLCALSIWREIFTVSVRLACHVNVATNVTRSLTKWAVDKTLI